jgi:pyridoxal phosphate enzyme (YggS family)
VLSASADIAANLAAVREQIAAVAVRCGRRAEEITLVGVSKTQPAEVLAEAIHAGLRDFGENRVQEAAAKLPRVRDLTRGVSATAHLVGHLQTNKVGAAVELFECVDSVDSLKLAEALSRRLNGRELPILLEIYVGDDANRPGIRVKDVDEVVGRVAQLPGLRIDGLMTVAPLGGDARAAFRQVRELRDSLAETYPRVHFGVLSMGMSEDFVAAIEEGSTQVRIGTALFGPRRTN